MIAFQVSDMTCARCAGAITKALKAVDHAALVRVDLATFTVEIEPSSATARQLGDAIRLAGYSARGGMTNFAVSGVGPDRGACITVAPWGTVDMVANAWAVRR